MEIRFGKLTTDYNEYKLENTEKETAEKSQSVFDSEKISDSEQSDAMKSIEELAILSEQEEEINLQARQMTIEEGDRIKDEILKSTEETDALENEALLKAIKEKMKSKDGTDVDFSKLKTNFSTKTPTIDEKTLQTSMLNDIEIQIAKLQSEIETTKDSKSGFGAFVDFAAGIIGKGTKGQLDDLMDFEDTLNQLKQNPDTEKIKELYAQIFNEEVDVEAYAKSVETKESLEQNDRIVLSSGQSVSKEDIAYELIKQATALSDSFKETVDSQGFFSGIASGINNFFGISTTKKMTQAQIDNYSNLVDQLKEAKTTEEFASLYKTITGEELNSDSLDELFNGESKVENSKAAETIMDYEESTKNTKNTMIAVSVGVATSLTGPIGVLAVGAIGTVGINMLDSITKHNGKSIKENLGNYILTDFAKDFLVGGLNGFTGKIGNIAGDKLATSLISKNVTATVSKETFKKSLSTGGRIATEFVDGAIDAGLASAGEYIINAAAGKNGNFSDEDGQFAFIENLQENFNLKDMLTQTTISTLMGGTMSVGMQEGIRLVGNGLRKLKNKDILGFEQAKSNIAKLSDDIDTSTIKTGEIFTNNDSKLVIKTRDGSMETLNMTAETFNELFPSAESLKIQQGAVGDCYLVTGIYAMLENPNSRVNVLRCFTENADGTITVKLPTGDASYTFKLSENLSESFLDMNKFSSGSKGVQVLEYVYGLDLVDDYVKNASCNIVRFGFDLDKYNNLYDIAKRIKSGEVTDINEIMELVDQVKLGGNTIVGYYGIGLRKQIYSDFLKDDMSAIDFKKVDSNINKYIEKMQNLQTEITELQTGEINIPAREISLRGDGGHVIDVFNRFGLAEAQCIDVDGDIVGALAQICKDDDFSNLLLAGGTRGSSDKLFLDKALDVVESHAYTIRPFIDENKNCLMFKIINPHHTEKSTTLNVKQLNDYFDTIHFVKF